MAYRSPVPILALALFFDVGTQVISIDTIINYAGEMGIGLIDAKVFLVHAYLHDYFLYVGNPSYSRLVSQTTALKFCSTLGSILSLGVVLLNFSVSFLGHSAISIWLLASIGFANALIYADMAVIDSWVGQVDQNRLFALIMAVGQCHIAPGLWCRCRRTRVTGRLLGVGSLFPVHHVVRVLWPQD